jgi:hypothetical protein
VKAMKKKKLNTWQKQARASYKEYKERFKKGIKPVKAVKEPQYFRYGNGNN